MKGIEFEEQNIVLGANNNPYTIDLAACRCVDPDGNIPYIVAKFEIDDDELEKINTNKHIYICIMGNSWPPLLPTGHNPFKDFGFVPNKKGLPNMKYRQEVYDVLRELFFNEDYMDDEIFDEFLQFMSFRFDFIQMGEQLEIGKSNGHSIKNQLEEFKKIAKNIVTIDELESFRKG